MKISVIDLGFNSIKLINYNVKNDNSFEPYEEVGLKIKLGEGLDDKGFLGRKAVWRTIDALKLFKDIINLQSIKQVLPIATSAVREAGNKEEFLGEVHDTTGFKFKVLSDKEEAWYSYSGAIKSLKIPNALFFDLGGGSLEIVYAEKFKIKKTVSLPLGALRLTQKYQGKDDMISGKNYKNMKQHILKLLPSRKELGMSSSTLLVGVGGTLRALAKYNQRISKYPLDKIHNYKMNHEAVNSISKRLSKMSSAEITKVDVFGTNRAETIVAGSCVINMIMEKLELDQIYVSNEGLREGTLSLYLSSPKTFHSKSVSSDTIHNLVASNNPKTNPILDGFLKGLISADLITDAENVILSYALRQILEKPILTNPLNWFYFMMDENSTLTHAEQLIFGLSVIRSRNSRMSDWLYTRYESILSPEDKDSMKKIAACIILFRILEQTRVKFDIKSINTKTVEMNFSQAKTSFPKVLLQNALRYFESAFDISVTHFVYPGTDTTDQSFYKINNAEIGKK